MANVTKVECYFKSEEIAKLCKKGEHIMISYEATNKPGKSTTYSIHASAMNSEKLLGDGTGSGIPGCPTPCK